MLKQTQEQELSHCRKCGIVDPFLFASRDHLPVVIVSVVGAEHHAIVNGHGSVHTEQFKGPLK